MVGNRVSAKATLYSSGIGGFSVGDENTAGILKEWHRKFAKQSARRSTEGADCRID